jgi:hypothetical protein
VGGKQQYLPNRSVILKLKKLLISWKKYLFSKLRYTFTFKFSIIALKIKLLLQLWLQFQGLKARQLCLKILITYN